MKTPIFDVIKRYQDKNPARFHTPGISGCNFYSPLYNFAPFDITELTFSDNLENPEGVIKEAEELCAKAYKSKKSLFFTSGATTAIYCALYVIKSFGKTILVNKNCHKSVYSACKVLNIKIKSIDISKDDIDNLLSSEDVCGLILTSPDYFGKCCDVKTISERVHNKNRFIIIDEAHGSHFIYSSYFPKSAVNYADMVIEGCHKTLPVQTGGCILNICNEKLINLAYLSRKLINTTSPSYLTLATLDYARAYFEEKGETLYKKVKAKIDKFIEQIRFTPYKVIQYDDFTRLNIECGQYSGYELNQKLQEFNIFAEMSYDNLCILIITPFNYERLDDLFKALTKITLKNKRIQIPDLKTIESAQYSEEIILLPINECLNRICMSEIGIYPPGTVILKTGDIINQSVIDFLNDNISRLFGLINDLVPVSKI